MSVIPGLYNLCPEKKLLLFLCPPPACVSWYTARLFMWYKKGVRCPLTPQKFVVWFENCEACCYELQVPSIQQLGTFISFSKVEFSQCPKEERKKKKLLDPLQLWQITAQDCLSSLKSISCSLILCTALCSTEAASTWIHLMKTLHAADRCVEHESYHSAVPPLTPRFIPLLFPHLQFAQTLKTRANSDIC